MASRRPSWAATRPAIRFVVRPSPRRRCIFVCSGPLCASSRRRSWRRGHCRRGRRLPHAPPPSGRSPMFALSSIFASTTNLSSVSVMKDSLSLCVPERSFSLSARCRWWLEAKALPFTRRLCFSLAIFTRVRPVHCVHRFFGGFRPN